MEVRIGGARLSLHPLLLLLPPLAALLGLRAELCAFAIGMTLHEASHLLAARALNIRVEELRLMPFGGAARLGNLYALSPARLFIVAAAGPAANLALVFVAAALAHWRVLSPTYALALMRASLIQMAFNLLPALPLDGGRMLYALTVKKLGRAKAVEVGIYGGRVVATALLIGTAALFAQSHRFNLSLPVAAVFILSSAGQEREALRDSHATTLLNALKTYDQPVPVQWFAVNEACPASKALQCATPDAAALYAVYSDKCLSAIVDERQIIEIALDDTKAPVGQAANDMKHKRAFRIHPSHIACMVGGIIGR